MGLAMAEPQAACRVDVEPNVEQQSRSWLAAYTRSRHESAVANQLQQKGLPILLPTYERLSRWSDRIRRIQSPLFPGYVFVCADDVERVRVLQTTGVVNIVARGGRPVPLSSEDVHKLRFCAGNPAAVEPHPFLRLGQRVRVKHGLFQGWEGVLIEKKNSLRLVITIEQIMRSVSIDLHGADVEPVN